jgi:hypothetical protein
MFRGGIGTIGGMRLAGLILLLSTTVLAAPPDLRLRYGSGWTGFKQGSSVTMKVTSFMPNRMLPAEVQVTTLVDVAKDELKLERVTKNQLTGDKKQPWTTPTSGEAGAGEKESVEKNEDEKIRILNRDWDCTKKTITVTGKSGKRVITQWTAKNPLLRIKRIEKHYDAKGSVTSTRSMVLHKAPAAEMVDGRELLCVTYRSLVKTGKVEQRQDSVHSRQIPGDLVSLEMKQYDGGKLVFTLQMRALRFEVK